MNKYWLLRYRVEFPLIICVLTTLIYSVNTNIFLFYRPTLTLFIALLIALIGVTMHIAFGKIPLKDDFQFNKYPINFHTQQIGDFFIWLGCAVFSGSWLVIITYILLYILFYGVMTKKHDKKEIKPFVLKRVIKRESSNFVLFMLGVAYLSALKNFLITESFFPTSWTNLLLVISISTFLLVGYIFKGSRK